MTRIIHLSDPHFGTVPDGLAARLLACLEEMRPDLVVLSGDLTQRALGWQYRQAAQFLSGLAMPVLVVPGNHDAPLWNIVQRLGDPWRNWRRHIARPLEAVVEMEGAVIIGLNSANPLVWKDGRVRKGQIAILRAAAARAEGRPCILVLHHPPAPPQGEPPSLSGAAALLAACGEAGVGMILSGHLHFTHVAPVTGARDILAVQAGTCLSSRLRGEGNAFTMLDVLPGAVAVSHHRLAADGAFHADATTIWRLGPEGWH